MSFTTIDIQPLAVDVSCNSDKLHVTLADGREIAVPLEWYPRLQEATPKERNDWQLLGGGLGIHWESLDEDVTVESLLRLRESFHRRDAEKTTKQTGAIIIWGG